MPLPVTGVAIHSVAYTVHCVSEKMHQL